MHINAAGAGTAPNFLAKYYSINRVVLGLITLIAH